MLTLENNEKIRFCNAMHELQHHESSCRACVTYIRWGDGDLCDVGKEIIAKHLILLNFQFIDRQNNELKKMLTGSPI